MRPELIAGDLAGANQVIDHAIDKLSLKSNDVIFYMQPTSPLRDIEQLKEIRGILARQNESVVTATVCGIHLENLVSILDDKIHFLIHEGQSFKQRQQLDQCYYINGSCFAFTVEFYQNTNSFYNKTSILSLSKKLDALDLDDMDDWILAELILQHRFKSATS